MDCVGGVTVTEEEVTEISDVQGDENIPERRKKWSQFGVLRPQIISN